MLDSGVYLLHGPGKLTVVKGIVQVLGYPVGDGGEVVVPVGRSVLVRVDNGAGAEYTGRSMLLSSEVYRGWERIVEEVGDINGWIMIVGPSDTGKSTLAAWIVNYMVREGGGNPLYATIDIGQNENFCPGFTSSVVVKDPPFIPGGGGGLYRACFVGSFTPAGNVSRYTYCSHSILEGWRGPVVVDSDGWVSLWDGVESKVAVAEAVGPDKILLVGLDERIKDYVGRKLRGVEVISLPRLVSSSKTRGERRVHRERLLARALSGGRERGFKVDETPVYGGPVFTGERVNSRSVEEVLGQKVYYAERSGGVLKVVARGRVSLEGVRIVRPGWERGLLSAVTGGGIVEPGIVTRVNYRSGILYVYTRFSGDPDYIELGSVRLNPDSFMGRAKW